MEQKNNRGGQRIGSGRKPLGSAKKQVITLYVPQKEIYPFGNEEKLKGKLYEFISSAGKVVVQDLNRTTNEIKPIEQPKTNYFVDTTPKPVQALLSPFTAFQKEILATKTVPEVEAIMKRVRAALMSGKEQQALEAIAKEHSRTMYTD